MASCVSVLLTGCFSTTRTVIKTHAPATVLTSSLDAIVKATSDRDKAITSLNASVDVVASSGGGKQGKVTEYIPFSAYILLRRPRDLHFIGLVPGIRTKMFDMVTDGKNFTIVIPPKSKAITGSNSVSTQSQNPLENLRPSVFLDALTIQSAGEGELVSLVSDDRIYQPDPARKYVVDEPEYDLGIYRNVAGSAELKTQRVIHIGRATLLPYQQDIYDEKGQLVTVATYDKYKMFGDTIFPSYINIRRPLDGLSLSLTVNKLAVNQKLDDDQFDFPNDFPKSYEVQHLP